MNLKQQCTKGIVDMIKNMPPVLKEEIIGESLKSIKEEARREAIKEIHSSANIVIEDVTERIINAHKTGSTWKRPKYTENMDEELY